MQVELSRVKYENGRITCNAILNGKFSIVGNVSFDGKTLFRAGNKIWSGSDATREAILQAVKKEYARHQPVQAVSTEK